MLRQHLPQANRICCHPEFSELFKIKPASDLGTFIPSLTFSTMGNGDSEAAKFQPCNKPQLEETVYMKQN